MTPVLGAATTLKWKVVAAMPAAQVLGTVTGQPVWLYVLALAVIFGPSWMKALRGFLGDLNLRAARKAALRAQTAEQRETALRVLRCLTRTDENTDLPADPEPEPPPQLPPAVSCVQTSPTQPRCERCSTGWSRWSMRGIRERYDEVG